jgi:HD-GYP domain-containing protein (c-di-GMP phosphodiesterase class II)
MMHDIGKAKIPKEIVNKPGKLDAAEFELMKQHTVEGYKILTNVEGIPEDVRLAALQHHERIDGSGYPLGLKAETIRDFSKIIAVADTYDAVTTDRVYQPKRPPLAVMEILDDEMFKKMDARSCLSMLVQIRDSLQGKRVVLKNGESGTIVFVGKHGTDDLVIRTDGGRNVNVGKSNYHKEISKYLG